MLSICRSWIHLIVLLCCFELTCSSQSESDDVTKFKHRFATKTTYNNRELDNDATLPWTIGNIPQYLKPVFIDATLRHGTRYPSEKRVKQFKKTVSKFQQLVKSSSHPAFADEKFRKSVLEWENKFPADKLFCLSKLGWDEHVALGVKYFLMMPDLWKQVLHNGSLLVLSSSKVRSMASAKAFITALQHFKKHGKMDYDHPDIIYSDEKILLKEDKMDMQCENVSIHVADDLLRFFDHCEKYLKMVEENTTAEFEFERYFKSETMAGILSEIPEIENKKDFYTIYQLCAFEQAVFNDFTWCHLFNESHMNALEYASDLKHYYKTGEGYAVNVEQSCVLLQNISERIGENLPLGKLSATLRFGHAETLIPLVALLGFYQNNELLRADNFDEHHKRAFRTSKISPFSGNMAVILYNSTQDTHIFISFVINEYFMKPFGLDCFFCDFTVIQKKIQEKLHGCDEVCKHNPTSSRFLDEL